jgi:hypothetical protein
MIKIIIAAFMIMAFATSAAALNSVIITEVLYDPANTDSGGEAVQLFNPTTSSIDISSWVIATETSSTDAVIPENTLLAADSYYLIADTGWSASKDSLSWPNANHEEAITLANNDAGVALLNNGTIIDAVGWGIASNIAAGLFEGAPAAETTAGKSLQRKKVNNEYVDTDNNSNDFIDGTPVFGTSSTSSSLILSIEAIITGAAPQIDLITIVDEDETTAGIQVSPVPKQNKSVAVTAQLTDLNGADDITEVKASTDSGIYPMTKESTINSTTAVFKTNISLPHYYAAGNHTVSVSAADNANLTANSSAAFEYLSLVAIELDTSTVTFSATPGATTEIIGDNNFETTSNPTILNIGNMQVDIELFGTNLAAGQSTIAASNIQYSVGNGYYKLTTTKRTEQINLQAGINSAAPLSLKLTVPLATQPGNYFGSLSIAGIAS